MFRRRVFHSALLFLLSIIIVSNIHKHHNRAVLFNEAIERAYYRISASGKETNQRVDNFTFEIEIKNYSFYFLSIMKEEAKPVSLQVNSDINQVYVNLNDNFYSFLLYGLVDYIPVFGEVDIDWLELYAYRTNDIYIFPIEKLQEISKFKQTWN